MANVKTITLGGAEQEVIISGQNCDIRNDGAEVIYASAKPNVTAGEDGVLAIPVGQAAKLLDSKGTVYLLGTGIVQLCGNDYSDLVFKSAPAGGGSGGTQDDVARNMASANAASISALRGDVEDVQTVAENISNPNLLINPDFKINQRGETEYTEGNKYTVDQWYTNIGAPASMTVSILSSGGIAISIDTSFDEVSDKNWITQRFEEMTFKTDTPVTLSVCAKGYFGITCYGTGLHNYHSDEFVVKSLTYTIPAGKRFGGSKDYLPLIGLSSTGTHAEFLWAKLELGSVATPFTPPDPATELAKCQRYYIPANLTAHMLSGGANELFFLCSLPAKMRTRPSLTSDTTFRMYKTSGNSYTGDEADWAIRVHSSTSSLANGVTLALTKEAHGVTAGERYLVITSGGFSAEL